MLKRFLPVVFVFVLFLIGCGPVFTPITVPTTAARTLNVFAAASLTEAFTEIGKNFEAANPGITVSFNFAGSPALRTQIEEGAPADVRVPGGLPSCTCC
jgi:molybdate transport system substrate-binding protein